jgi:cytochrome P450
MLGIEPGKVMALGPLPSPYDKADLTSPIRWATALTGTGFWLITDYKLARYVLADQRFRRSEAAGPKAPKLSTYNASPDAIVSLDGPEHTRIRGVVARSFSEGKIALLAPFVAGLVGDLLDGLGSQSSPADFVAHVSSPLPFGVLCHLLGIPMADREVFGSWVNVLFRLSGDRTDSRQHSISLTRYMVQLVAAKRRKPAADLISDLIRSADQEKALTDRELVTLCLSLLMAGYDSTVDQITLSVLMLMLDRSLMKTLREKPELIARAIEELLRLNPAPFVTFPRMAVESVSVGDVRIEAGQLVVIFFLASNRDPSVFTPADEVALEQSMPAHLTFGHGVHRCVGAPLARLQLTTLLTALLRRFPELRLADDLSSLDWKTGMATRGLGRMLVSW